MSSPFRLPLVGITLVLIVAAAAAAEAQSPCSGDLPEDGLTVTGRLNGASIQAFIDTSLLPADPEEGVSGVFFYPDKWTPGSADDSEFGLEGTLNGNCELRLKDSADGIWRLRLVVGLKLEGAREYEIKPGTL